MQESLEQKSQNLKTHLNLIKTMKDQEAENEFFALMEKAKTVFGETHPQMAFYYFQYANFLMIKMQQNMDIFNAGALPRQQQEQLDQINECYQELSQNEEDSAKQSNNEKQKQAEFKDANVVITQDKAQNKVYNSNQQVEKADINQGENQKNEEENQSDIQICYENLECALKIYLEEKEKYQNGQDTYLDKQLIDRYISRVRSRLADLYMMDEHYPEAVNEYRTVIAENQKIDGHQWKRVLAEIHYLIGNAYLYQNKEACQKIAISQYVKAIKILVRNLQVENSYDTFSFQLPNQQKLKVDRFAYLMKPNDSETVKEIKDIINILLDKIEDTCAQLNQKEKYQNQRKKLEEQNKNNVFKEVDKNVKVTSLGVFGNRKKTAEESGTPNKEKQSQNNSSLKKQSSKEEKNTVNEQNQKAQQKISINHEIQEQKPI